MTMQHPSQPKKPTQANKTQPTPWRTAHRAAKLALLGLAAAVLVACGGGGGSPAAIIPEPVIASAEVTRLSSGQWAWTLTGQNLPDDLELTVAQSGVCAAKPVYLLPVADRGTKATFTCTPGTASVIDFTYSFSSAKASNLNSRAISGQWTAATATLGATPITPSILQTVELQITNAWSSIKSVVFSFVDGVANFATKTATVLDGVSQKISGTFTKSGEQIVTATYKDAYGNTLGVGTHKVNVAPGTVTTTATITQVINDNTTPNSFIPKDSITTDSTPKITGTVSAALVQMEQLRVYDNGSGNLIGTATVAADKTWSLTLTTPLASGSHSLSAAVWHTGYSASGPSSTLWPFTVQAAPTPTSKLPHSGITASQCYSAGSNTLMACSGVANDLNAQQDGHRASLNAMSYSKVGFSGEALDSNASSWCAVKDNVTGLLWQNHQAAPATFTNWGDNRAGDASKYAADNATLCGQSGWRLPTVDELQSIVDYSKPWPGPTINTTWFPNTPGTWYWSSSPDVGLSGSAWSVYFRYGFVSLNFRFSGNHVRLVRASQ